MKGRCWLFFTLAVFSIVFAEASKTDQRKLVKRQLSSRNSNERGIPLSRSRQFPPPEELEDSEEHEEESEEDSALPPVRRYSSQFRGRQQPQDYSDETVEDYPYSESPATTTTTTTTTTAKPPARISTFNRSTSRPKFGFTTSRATTQRTTTARSRSRSTAASAPAQRIDISAVLNNPQPPRPSARSAVRKPLLEETTEAPRRVNNSGRPRARGRFRARTSSTTTTTTTTTTAAPAAADEYYYYYYDEADDAKQPLATSTTSTTTTTTTTKAPSLARKPLPARRGSSIRSSQTSRAPAKFDPESQFEPPPDDVAVTIPERTTKRFTTSTTVSPPPDGIPPHLRSKYKPRTDGRFVDYLRDPNRPRELKGFDLTDYPFYVKVPDDIVFDCEDKKDGYYASVPHHCQLFHYCFAGSRYDFLCANYTLYDQTTFTCRFANNVDCASSENFYYRNDDLWKEVTTTPAPTPEPKKKKVVRVDDDDYEDEEYEDDEEYDEEEEEERRKPRPRRRKNRRRKNRRKPASE